MGFLRQIFGPSREEIWRQLSSEIDAQYVQGGFWKGDKVQIHHEQWTITLDTYTVSHSTGKTHLPRPTHAFGLLTSIRTVSNSRFIEKDFSAIWANCSECRMWKSAILNSMRHSSSRAMTSKNCGHLFANPKIRQLLEMQPAVHLTVKDDEGWFSTAFPEGVDELYFSVVGVIKDVERLKSLYYLFAEVLNQLCHIGSAYENDPQLEL